MRSALVVATTAALAAQASAHNPINIARTAGGQLTHHIHAQQPEPLNPSVFPEYPGWADFDVAIEALDKDHEDDGLFTLDSAANIDLRVVAADQGVRVAFALAEFIEPGTSFNLGHSYFHFHPAWNIFEGEIGHIYEITFQLHDRTGMYADSEPFNVSFTPIPAPAGIVAMSLGFAACTRRRR